MSGMYEVQMAGTPQESTAKEGEIIVRLANNKGLPLSILPTLSAPTFSKDTTGLYLRLWSWPPTHGAHSTETLLVSTGRPAVYPTTVDVLHSTDRLRRAFQEQARGSCDSSLTCTALLSATRVVDKKKKKIDLLGGSWRLVGSNDWKAGFAEWWNGVLRQVRLDTVGERAKAATERLPLALKAHAPYDLCLCMIVRDEAHIVTEALTSLLSAVDCWCIVDTGSVDDTKEVISDFFKRHDRPGRMVQGYEWKDDFGESRTFALRQCVGMSRFVFMFDADDLLEGRPRWPNWETTACDGFVMRFGEGKERVYWCPRVFRNDGTWVYRGVLHEQPTNGIPLPDLGWIKGRYHVESRRVGGRNRLGHRRLRDAFSLERSLMVNPHDAMDWFYLARSYFEYGAFSVSLECFGHLFAAIETRDDTLLAAEAWTYMGRAHTHLGQSEKAVSAYQAAIRASLRCHRWRLEPHYHLLQLWRLGRRFASAWQHIQIYLIPCLPFGLPLPSGMPIDLSLYKYRVYEEMALCAASLQRPRIYTSLIWLASAFDGLDHSDDASSRRRMCFNTATLLEHLPVAPAIPFTALADKSANDPKGHGETREHGRKQLRKGKEAKQRGDKSEEGDMIRWSVRESRKWNRETIVHSWKNHAKSALQPIAAWLCFMLCVLFLVLM